MLAPNSYDNLGGPTIVKEGWLKKADKSGGNWQQRWCVLLPNAFSYYTSPDKRDANIKGAFELRQAQVVAGWNLSKKAPTQYVFQLVLPKRHYYFAAATDMELREWTDAIRAVLTPSQPPSSAASVDEDAYSGISAPVPSYAPPPMSAGLGLPGLRGAMLRQSAMLMPAMPAIREAPEEAGQSEGAYDRASRSASMDMGAEGWGNNGYPQDSRRGSGSTHVSLQVLSALHQHAQQYAPGAGTGLGGGAGSSAEPRPVLSSSYLSSHASSSGGADADPQVTFYVVQGGRPDAITGLVEPEKKYTMVMRASKIAKLTMAKIKKSLAKSVGHEAGDMVLTVDGDDSVVLGDDWTGADIQLGDMSSLRLTILVAPPQLSNSSNSSGSSPARKQKSKRGSGVAASLPSIAQAASSASSANAAPAPAAAVADSPTAAPVTAAAPAPAPAAAPSPTSAHTPAPAPAAAAAAAPGSARSPGVVRYYSTASLDPKVEKKLVARNVFKELAAGDADPMFGGSRSGSAAASASAGADAISPQHAASRVNRAEYAAALFSVPGVESWPEYDALVTALLAPAPASASGRGGHGGSLETISWTEFSAALAAILESGGKPSLSVSPAAHTASSPRGFNTNTATTPKATATASPTAASATSTPAAATAAAAEHASAATASSAAAASEAGAGSGTAAEAAAAAAASPWATAASVAAAAAAAAPAPVAVALADIHPPRPVPRPSTTTPVRVMVVAVDLGEGRVGELRVRVGVDPEATAAAFMATHGLEGEDVKESLLEEIKRSLLDAYAAELQDAKASAASVANALEEANSRLDTAAKELRSTHAAAVAAVAEAKACKQALAAAEAAAQSEVAAAHADTATARADAASLRAAATEDERASRLAAAEAALAASRDTETALRAQLAAQTAAVEAAQAEVLALQQQLDTVQSQASDLVARYESDLAAWQADRSALVAAHESELATAAAAAEAQLAAQRAELTSACEAVAAERDAALEQSKALASDRAEMERQMGELREAVKRKAVWDRYVGSAAGDAGLEGSSAAAAVDLSASTSGLNASAMSLGATPTAAAAASSSSASIRGSAAVATLASGDWRQWAAEKRDILARANADRAALIEENKRLRASLDIRGVDAESRLRAADEEKAHMASEFAALSTARNRAEAELRSVYQQWQQDGQRWASERKRLQEQVDALMGMPAPAPAPALNSSPGSRSVRSGARVEL